MASHFQIENFNLNRVYLKYEVHIKKPSQLTGLLIALMQAVLKNRNQIKIQIWKLKYGNSNFESKFNLDSPN